MSAHTVKRWTHPSNYAGATWNQYFSAGFGQSRDSDAWERVNFEVAFKAIREASDPDAVEPPQVVREGHWAVGWVEWIAISETDASALKCAEGLCESANDYPILDDDRLSEVEAEEASQTWADASIKERLHYMRGTKICCLAARHDWIPSDDDGRIQERLLGC